MSLERDLDSLHRSILTMAGQVEDAIAMAVAALHSRDPDLAREVIERDGEIDELENALQEECVEILTRHPAAPSQLRRISVVQLLTTDLERVGDLAVELAERAIFLSKPPHVPIPERLDGMATQACKMLRAALDCFVYRDPEAARAVILADDEVDADNDAMIEEVVALMKRSPESVEGALSLFSAVRHIEGVADYATSIAEEVIYLVHGEFARHHPEVLRRA